MIRLFVFAALFLFVAPAANAFCRIGSPDFYECMEQEREREELERRIEELERENERRREEEEDRDDTYDCLRNPLSCELR